MLTADQSPHLAAVVFWRAYRPRLCDFLTKRERVIVNAINARATRAGARTGVFKRARIRFITHHKLRQKLVHDILLHINAAAAQADLALIGKAEGSLWNRSECVCDKVRVLIVHNPKKQRKLTLLGPAARRRPQCQRRYRRWQGFCLQAEEKEKTTGQAVGGAKRRNILLTPNSNKTRGLLQWWHQSITPPMIAFCQKALPILGSFKEKGSWSEPRRNLLGNKHVRHAPLHLRPVSVPPVKEMMGTSSCATRGPPVAGPVP